MAKQSLTEEQVRWAVDQIKDRKLTREAAAKKLFVGYNTLYVSIRRYGLGSEINGVKIIPARTKIDPDEARRLYNLGWSDGRIAAELGVEQCPFTQFRHRMGWPPNIKPQGGRKRAV